MIQFLVDQKSWGRHFNIPYHISAAAIAVFSKEKITLSEVDVPEDIYVVLDLSASAWKKLVTEHEGWYPGAFPEDEAEEVEDEEEESRRRLWGRAFSELHSAIPPQFTVPVSYFKAFLEKPENPNWPETNVATELGWRTRDQWEAQQRYIMLEMIKRGMTFAAGLKAKVEELARKDEDRFSKPEVFYQAD